MKITVNLKNIYIFLYIFNVLGYLGADVPKTEAGSGKREATSRNGTLQEVFDAATDTLAKSRPL